MSLRSYQAARDEAMRLRHYRGGDTAHCIVNGTIVFDTIVDNTPDAETFLLGGDNVQAGSVVHVPNRLLAPNVWKRDYDVGNIFSIDGEEYEIVSIRQSPDSSPMDLTTGMTSFTLQAAQ